MKGDECGGGLSPVCKWRTGPSSLFNAIASQVMVLVLSHDSRFTGKCGGISGLARDRGKEHARVSVVCGIADRDIAVIGRVSVASAESCDGSSQFL